MKSLIEFNAIEVNDYYFIKQQIARIIIDKKYKIKDQIIKALFYHFRKFSNGS
jgi:hypothetical protein